MDLGGNFRPFSDVNGSFVYLKCTFEPCFSKHKFIFMQLSNQILSTGEQIKALVTSYPPDTPVVMVNILKFKEGTGLASYAKYSKAVAPLLAANGGKLVFKGDAKNVVIGSTDSPPDMILLVQYPSIQHFLAMAQSKEYAAISHLREEALEYGGLIATQP